MTNGCGYNGTWSYLGTNNDNHETNDNEKRLQFICKRIHCHTWYSPTGFTKIIDYILAEWHIKKLSSNCRVYRGASIPFETSYRHRKGNTNYFFHIQSKPPIIHTNIKYLKGSSNICDNYSKRLDTLLAKEPNINDINQF